MNRRSARQRHASLEVILFEVGGVSYGVDLSQVAGLVKDVPDDFQSPYEENCCILFQGKEVPVYRGEDFLSGGVNHSRELGEALILDDGSGLFGLAVDSTSGVVEVFPGDNLYTFPPQKVSADRLCEPWGVLDRNGRDFLLVDLRPGAVH